MSLRKILFVPDTHVPYHDKRAWALMCKTMRAWKPDTLVHIGDLADFYSVSAHDKDGGRANRMEWELEEVNRALDDLDALGATDKRFVEGNHCLDLSHRLLTPQGWKGHGEIAVGDLVGVRLVSGVFGWERVERVVVRPLGDEQMYLHESPSRASICVTEGHIVWEVDDDGVMRRRAAREMPDSFDLPVALGSGRADYPLGDNDIRLAAWASTDVHYTRATDSVVFYQAEGEGGDRLRRILEVSGLPYQTAVRRRPITSVAGRLLVKPPKAGYEFRLRVEAGRVVRGLTGLDRKGRLPAWVMHLSDRQWGVFLDELIAADGTGGVGEKGARVFYGKKEICEDVQIAAVTHGWRASITEYRPNQFRVNLTPRQVIRVSGWKQKVVSLPPSTPVWCVTVPSGTLVTERGGCVHITGNCDRLRRYLQKHPELMGVVSTQKLLRLKERGWKFTPYKRTDKIGKCHLTHDVGASGRNSVQRALDTYQHTVITGHSHRFQYIVEGNALGEPKLSAAFGWLGDVEQIDYMHVHKAKKDWALGFGIGYLDPKTGYIYVVPVPIIDYSCMVEGKVYRG